MTGLVQHFLSVPYVDMRNVQRPSTSKFSWLRCVSPHYSSVSLELKQKLEEKQREVVRGKLSTGVSCSVETCSQVRLRIAYSVIQIQFEAIRKVKRLKPVQFRTAGVTRQ